MKDNAQHDAPGLLEKRAQKGQFFRDVSRFGLERSVSQSSCAIFSGLEVSTTLHPMPLELRKRLPLQLYEACLGRFFFLRGEENEGQSFLQGGLEALSEGAIVPAHIDHVIDTSRRTTVLGAPLQEFQGSSNSLPRIAMVEHLLSALEAEGVEDVLIETSGEIPMLDGSAMAWCEVLQEAKKEKHSYEAALRHPEGFFKARPLIVFEQEQIFRDESGSFYLLLPPSSSMHEEAKDSSPSLRLTVMIDYPHEPLIGSQVASLNWDERWTENYRREIAPCRSFCSKRELQILQEKGLLRGGALTSGLVYEGEKVLTPGGLRAEHEMARHKLLDLIGDFSLAPYRFAGHLITLRPGHQGNISCARAFVAAWNEESKCHL